METTCSNSSKEPSYKELLAANEYLKKQASELKEEATELQKEATQYKEWYNNLLHHLLQLKKQMYGRKSEKFLHNGQRQEPLFPADEDEVTDENVTSVEVSSHARHSRKRKKLPEDLPRERIEYEPEDCNCADCGQVMARIGEEITEQVETVPAKIYVVEHARIQRACPKCKSGVVTGKLPAETQIIEGSKAGASLLAQIVTSKYCDHIPLNRQEQILARHGIDISRKRMSDWIGIITQRFLKPIAEALKRDIVQSNYIWADETTIKTQVNEGETTSLKQGYLWGMQSLSGDVYFEYNLSRSADVALSLFEGCRGYIQTDLYAGYNEIFVPESVERVGCWAHARRKFVEAQKSAQKDCDKVLKLIAGMYQVEKKAKQKFKKLEKDSGGKLPQEKFYEIRQELREEHLPEIAKRLKGILESLSQSALPKSPVGKAVTYTLKQWEALTLPFGNGMLELDNNAIERQMRPIAVGRNNWLFTGSERGAESAACLFSLIGTCKLNKINPFEYIHDVLRLSKVATISAEELTPRKWKLMKDKV